MAEADPQHIKKVLDEYDEWAKNAAANIAAAKAKRIHHYVSCMVYVGDPCSCGATD